MFQFAGFPPTKWVITAVMGLPHSDIAGSQPAHGSPTLIAGMPRPSSARCAKAFPVCSSCLPCWNTYGGPSVGVQLHPPMGSAFEKKTKKTNNKKKKKLVTHLHLVRYNEPIQSDRIGQGPSPLKRDDSQSCGPVGLPGIQCPGYGWG